MKLSQSVVYLILGLICFQSRAAVPAYGTLVINSEKMALASVDGEGNYLIIPGVDLKLNRLKAENHRVNIHCGSRRWAILVRIKAGCTTYLSPGSPAKISAEEVSANRPDSKPSESLKPAPRDRPSAAAIPLSSFGIDNSREAEIERQLQLQMQQEEEEQRRPNEARAEEAERRIQLQLQREEEERLRAQQKSATKKRHRHRRPKAH